MSDAPNVDFGNWILHFWKRPEYLVYIAEALYHPLTVGYSVTGISPGKALGENYACLGLSAGELVISSEPRTVQSKSGLYLVYTQGIDGTLTMCRKTS